MGWQPNGLLFPDAEAVVISAVTALLLDAGEDVPVRRVIPRPRPARFVAVNRDGGATSNGVDRARMRLRVWAEDAEAVNDLSRLLLALLPQLVINGTATYFQHISGPLDIPDDSQQEQRYLLVEIHLEAEGEPA